MLRLSRYVRILFFLCVGSIVCLAFLLILTNLFIKNVGEETLTRQSERRQEMEDVFTMSLKERNFPEEQVRLLTLNSV